MIIKLAFISSLLLFSCVSALDVPNCVSSETNSLRFSYINGSYDSTTSAGLCHDNTYLYIKWEAIDAEVIAPYKQCNDPLYNADAV